MSRYSRRQITRALAATCLAGASGAGRGARAAAAPVRIGLDGEFGYVGSTSAEAIGLGIRIAIDEVNAAGGVLGGRPLELVERANGSLPARSANNIAAFAADPDLVAIYCGRFSPTVLETLPLIHRLGVPLLDPWAAADGIIDNGYRPSFAFRLSLKDSWAAEVALEHLRRRGLGRVGLLMLNTSWGRSSKKAAEAYAMHRAGLALSATQWINWDDEPESMLAKIEHLRGAGAQAIFLTANAEDAAKLCRAQLAQPAAQRLPVASHWGVAGGNLPAMVGPAFRELDFSVVQTYSFLGQTSALCRRVVGAALKITGGRSERAIASPVGVAHAYDLTHILARAIGLAGSTNRHAVRDALEHVPVHDGLIKRYAPPFTAQRHEALAAADVFMATYSSVDGALERRA
ncbi:MAG: ABC transporter substrate-binding protein [Burkholderiales bacterium]|nr:ABC transporter substrate-binding protein [Burkholderiales bacterium]MDE1928081.1 ABC transporter substrate-binding protein [Burkholderiales bacterium]MDE2158504.1 ABC transporter substrate-binding protein [Burkholderiales bacterium]